MQNEIVEINSKEVVVKEFRGQRVVTFKDIDRVHERPDGTARRNFNINKNHFILGEDYFVRNSFEAKEEFGVAAPKIAGYVRCSYEIWKRSGTEGGGCISVRGADV